MELTKEEFLRLSMPTSGTPLMDIRPGNTCYYNGEITSKSTFYY